MGFLFGWIWEARAWEEGTNPIKGLVKFGISGFGAYHWVSSNCQATAFRPLLSEVLKSTTLTYPYRVSPL